MNTINTQEVVTQVTENEVNNLIDYKKLAGFFRHALHRSFTNVIRATVNPGDSLWVLPGNTESDLLGAHERLLYVQGLAQVAATAYVMLNPGDTLIVKTNRLDEATKLRRSTLSSYKMTVASGLIDLYLTEVPVGAVPLPIGDSLIARTYVRFINDLIGEDNLVMQTIRAWVWSLELMINDDTPIKVSKGTLYNANVYEITKEGVRVVTMGDVKRIAETDPTMEGRVFVKIPRRTNRIQVYGCVKTATEYFNNVVEMKSAPIGKTPGYFVHASTGDTRPTYTILPVPTGDVAE